MGEVVIGISGASGAIYGKRLTEILSEMGKTVRLVVTDSGKLTLKHECDTTPKELAEATRLSACLHQSQFRALISLFEPRFRRFF